MELSIIKIKCPFCGVILSVKNCPGIEDKNVACPMCKQRSRFKSCKRLPQLFDCNDRLSIDSIMYRYTPSEEERYIDFSKNKYRQCGIEYPYSISVITLNENNIFRIYGLKRVLQSSEFDQIQIENIRCSIKELDKKWELQETYYLCPVCGNVMIVTSWPREFGDDYVCKCPCCKNGFYFGGTRFPDDDVKQINEISANPIILARNVYTNKTQMIAKILQSEIFLIDNYRLIFKAFVNGWLVSHIMKLNIN